MKVVQTSTPECQNLLSDEMQYYECVARKHFISVYHPVGTCKMGPASDPRAVVDSRLKVYGIEGLRVIDASIMPIVTRANTNAPSIMIGEKGSDLIKKDWLSENNDCKDHFCNIGK
ncbi:glucose dehydrogenase [FAD, quinone]-like [Copidosoma floridanum]|uniref:glucose dehydrogenase [FAD, quinone]-like n=1 Tax=Copidosoma floridanum TaxID=29053 RepID=UPI000C6F5F35|nr:glucose dehydrogenase [FAD, quinone]-like [Copidosoma floridanum]